MFDLQKGDKILYTKTKKTYIVINITINRVLIANDTEKIAIHEAELRKGINKKEIEIIYQ